MQVNIEGSNLLIVRAEVTLVSCKETKVETMGELERE